MGTLYGKVSHHSEAAFCCEAICPPEKWPSVRVRLYVSLFFPPPVRFTVPKGSLFSLSLGLSVRCTHVTTTTTILALAGQKRKSHHPRPRITLSTFRSNAFFLSRAQHGRHGRRATDHGQRLRGRPNVPRRRPSPGALRPAAVLTAWRRPLAPTPLFLLSCCC